MHGTDFKEVAEVRPDEKHRITLKKIKRAEKVYRIYENELGQIILDPMLLVPASEMWLHENKKALASVRQGLKEAAEGKIRPGPSYAEHADDVLDD